MSRLAMKRLRADKLRPRASQRRYRRRFFLVVRAVSANKDLDA
jgi:hypothetical protein